MQVAPTLKPVIVVVNGIVVDAEPDAGVGVPLVQVTLTGTEAVPLSGTKSLCTVKMATFRLFRIAQLPVPEGAPLIVPVHVPVDV